MNRPTHQYSTRQRGVVLFFALMALLAMSLAAVALIRSVDTSTVIAGNLAFKQAATNSSDAGVDAAITWLNTTNVANAGLNVNMDAAHAFNNSAPTSGYYSNLDTTVSLTDGTGIQWNNNDSCPVNANMKCTGSPATDSSGNSSRYVIQRLCRNANQPISTAMCLFSSAALNNNGFQVPLPQDICAGPGCPTSGQTPQIRITTQTRGPRNTLSYVQVFIY